jgi:hypothetical protein
MELKLLAIYRRALLEVISISNLWIYLVDDQCCFLGSESNVYLRSLYWWFLVITVCLLQAGIPGNLQNEPAVVHRFSFGEDKEGTLGSFGMSSDVELYVEANINDEVHQSTCWKGSVACGPKERK